MLDNIKKAKGLFVVASLLLLASCTGMTPVQEITADRDGYLDKKFTEKNLSASVAAKIPKDSKAPGFGRIVIVQEGHTEKNDGKKVSWRFDETFVDKGNGLVQATREIFFNDIPSHLYLRLTYKGMMALIWQKVGLQAHSSGWLYETKDITRFDAMPSKPGKDFVVDYAYGGLAQLANFQQEKISCKSTRVIPAANLHKKLSGKALEFECEALKNNAPQYRATWALLQDYGIALQRGEVSTTDKVTIRVIDVKK